MHNRSKTARNYASGSFHTGFYKTHLACCHRRLRTIVIIGIQINILRCHPSPSSVLNNFQNSEIQSTVSIPVTSLASSFVSLCPSHVAMCSFVSRRNSTSLYFLSGKSGHKNQNCLLLIYASQIKQITVLTKAHRSIRIGGHDVIGVNHHEQDLASDSFNSLLRFDMKSSLLMFLYLMLNT